MKPVRVMHDDGSFTTRENYVTFHKGHLKVDVNRYLSSIEGKDMLRRQRDPRVNPKIGDITVSEDGTRYYVTFVKNGIVGLYGGDFPEVPLETWRHSAKYDKVVRHGDLFPKHLDQAP